MKTNDDGMSFYVRDVVMCGAMTGRSLNGIGDFCFVLMS